MVSENRDCRNFNAFQISVQLEPAPCVRVFLCRKIIKNISSYNIDDRIFIKNKVYDDNSNQITPTSHGRGFRGIIFIFQLN